MALYGVDNRLPFAIAAALCLALFAWGRTRLD
jgi:hypothetical protein